MNGPDGPEQRTADAEERSEREYDELDRTEDRAEYSTSDVADEVRKATADSLDTISRLTQENDALYEEILSLRTELREAQGEFA